VLAVTTIGMKPPRTWILIAVSLLTLGIFSFVLQPVVNPKPDPVCVADNKPSSGFVDSDKKCNISIASWNKIADWESSPKPFRIVGSVLILAGIAIGIGAGVRSRRG